MWTQARWSIRKPQSMRAVVRNFAGSWSFGKICSYYVGGLAHVHRVPFASQLMALSCRGYGFKLIFLEYITSEFFAHPWFVQLQPKCYNCSRVSGDGLERKQQIVSDKCSTQCLPRNMLPALASDSDWRASQSLPTWSYTIQSTYLSSTQLGHGGL